jgi:hypothetical protein
MAWLLVTFILLLLLTRWLTKHIQGIGYLLTEDGHFALSVYLLLTLPGVLLHELSHAVTAWLLRVPVGRFSIGISQSQGSSRRRGSSRQRGSSSRKREQVALGTVEIGSSDFVRASLIGLAPLITGCTVTLVISRRIFGIDQLGAFGSQQFWQDLAGIYRTPDFWLWAYLVFAVGNAMFPSASDRHAWWQAILAILFVGTVLYFAGLWDSLVTWIGTWLQYSIDYLTYAFAITIVIDIIFGTILFLIEQGLGLLGFGRIEYRAR